VKEGFPGLRAILKDEESRKEVWNYIENYAPSWPPAWACSFPESAGYERIHVMGFKQEKNRQYDTKSIAEIGKMMGKKPFDAISDLIVEGEEPTCTVAALNGDLLTPTDEPLRQMAIHPLAMFGTDSVLAESKPRGKVWNPHFYGTFPRVVGRFVREKVLTLEEAVRKSTSLPAWRLGCRRRGQIREGMYADLVIFDKDKLTDTALDLRPDPVRRDDPEGIHYVLVNGKTVVDKGEHDTKVLAGHVLRRKDGVIQN
jgi:N-acyl-D-amino-acid deacylase